MLGALMRPTAAYNSNGLGLLEPRAAAAEAQELVAEGFRAVKMRLGRPSGYDDLAAVRAVRGDRTGRGSDIRLQPGAERQRRPRALPPAR
jgi:L-alanine-DL-glutamate epimerase-like enolase superfamily enzyme